MSRTIKIPVDGKEFSGYLALPEKGSGPGLVLLQEIYGVSPSMRAAADLYAQEGYVVLVPDLFWRIEPNVQLGYDQQPKAFEYYGKFDVDQGVKDIGVAVAALRQLPECKGGVAAMGFCLGGLLAFLGAARLELDAAIGFYGVKIDEYLGELGNVRCPLMLHLGGKDHYNPPDKVAKIRAACAPNEQISIYEYPEADHGFYLPGRAAYDKLAAQLAHSYSIGLLRRVLGPHYDLVALWEKHCELEFSTRNADETMKTMVAQPYVNHIPTMTGGVGQTELHRFYKNHFIPTLPEDTHLKPVSRTIGADRLVDELLFCFTHTKEIDWLLPGVKPTGKYVEVPTIAVVCFRGDKLYHEHIYWDQASVLVQLGLLDPHGLPVAGIETARKLVDEKQPSNTLMKRWAESAGKT
ncbi:MAG: dienelactone hydrolase family protein [Gemmataceae bacterium]